jgi:hypothetical protein
LIEPAFAKALEELEEYSPVAARGRGFCLSLLRRNDNSMLA